jgi:hypothetical protein
MAESLERHFDEAMHELYGRIVRECGGRYHPTIFHDMIEKHGGLQTAHLLLKPDAYFTYFTHLSGAFVAECWKLLISMHPYSPL